MPHKETDCKVRIELKEKKIQEVERENLRLLSLQRGPSPVLSEREMWSGLIFTEGLAQA